jgi:hypothetical protein
MFAIPGILALVAFIYIRPQEFLAALTALPLLYIFLGLAVFGQVLDLKLRISKPRATPQLVFALLFYLWCVLSMALFGAHAMTLESVILGVAIILYLTPAHAVQSFRVLHVIAGTLLAIALFLAAISLYQAQAAWGCVLLDPQVAEAEAEGTPDGRPCKEARDCYLGDPEPGADYICERIGVFGTTSVGGGRVRYRGVLQDPNELALALSLTLPFAFLFYERRRSLARGVLLVFSLGLIGLTCFYTRSRGGQLVFMAVLATYFVRRFRWRGVLMGLALAAPLALLQGPRADAAQSTEQRLEAWYEGMTMFRDSPALGVGMTKFTEHHWITAHNAYILAAAELGAVGLFLWTALLYLSVKIPLLAIWRYRRDPSARIANLWGWAMLANWLGCLVGITFLSFTYHYVLWINLGLSGALFSCIKSHDPDFEVGFGLRDLFAVAALDVAIVFLFFFYTRWQSGEL